MSTNEAMFLYDHVSDRYHKKVLKLYKERTNNLYKKLGWFHPIYNNPEAERKNKTQLKLILIGLLTH